MTAKIIWLAKFQSLDALRRLVWIAEDRYQAEPTLDNFGAMVDADVEYSNKLHADDWRMDDAG